MGQSPGFEVVILAGGKGSRLGELAVVKEKPLLPIANRPMIYYPLKLAQDAGFPSVHVICQESVKTSIKAIPGKFGLTLELICHCLASDTDFGTVDALKQISTSLSAPELIILSCDLITTVPLRKLVNEHAVRESAITALFTRNVDPQDNVVPGQKAKFVPENDLIGIDEETGRLVFMTSKADLEETFPVRIAEISAYPKLWVSSSLADAHAYIFKRWVFDYLVSSNLSMLKAEFIPHVVRKQFEKPTSFKDFADNMRDEVGNGRSSLASADIFPFVPRERETEELREMSALWEYAGNRLRKHLDAVNKIRCYACIVDSELCIRGNNLLTYLKANLEASTVLKRSDPSFEPIHPSVNASSRLRQQLASSCIVGDETSIADKVSAKRSVIGSKCKLEDKSKIVDSLLADECLIEGSASIQGCIICEKASVGERCDLKNCIVAPGFRVPPSTKAKNEVLSNEGMLLDD